jgi:hypothetical protein
MIIIQRRRGLVRRDCEEAGDVDPGPVKTRKRKVARLPSGNLKESPEADSNR